MNYMDEFIKSTDFNQNKPIRKIVYYSLRKTIISGIIPAGARIVEKEYAERLNISRTPVRDALRALEMDGLVEFVPKVGAVVKRITAKDVIEIYEIRKSLEVLAAVNAMNNITEKEIKDINTLLDVTEKKNNEGKVKEVIKLFGEFNFKLYKASRMNRLANMISKLNEYTQKFRNISISENCRREKALVEHKQIFKAIVKNDKEKIGPMIKNHLDISLKVVLSRIKS